MLSTNLLGDFLEILEYFAVLRRGELPDVDIVLLGTVSTDTLPLALTSHNRNNS